MKILDRYILSTYLKTFLSVLILLLLIFVLQAVWLYISELAGKDLDTIIIIKFLMYVLPTLVPLILPLSILLASIMVFGKFAENYEFAAMKSTGISLQRAMSGLSIFIFALAIGAFFFANNVIPVANYNFYNLRKNIAKQKPSMAIISGQFVEIGDINIIVAEKTGDRGQYLKNVIIHKKKPNKRGNYTVIISETGELISSDDSNMLQLELSNGNYYDEIINKNRKKNLNKPDARSTFKKYTINVDLEGLNKVDFEEKKYDNRFNMYGVSALNHIIDSLKQQKQIDFKTLSKTLYNRTTYHALTDKIKPVEDSTYTSNILNLFDVKTKIQVLNLALTTAKSTTQVIDVNAKTITAKNKRLNNHIMALHEKYVLFFACIILFFVGAPLGALIRKGGIGLPMVIAILLFLTYHFIGLFAKNSAKNGTLDPVLAAWLSTLIMLPLSIYLTSRATKDRGLFEFSAISEPLRRLFSFKNKRNYITVEGNDYSYFNNYTDEKLINVLKNSDSNNYENDSRYFALTILEERKISADDMQNKGIVLTDTFNSYKSYFKDYTDYSITSLITYSLGAILIILHFIFKNNKLPELASSVLDLGLISLFIYIIYFIISHYYYYGFYKHIDRKNNSINFFLLILSLPFYPIVFLYSKFRIKKDYNETLIENIK